MLPRPPVSRERKRERPWAGGTRPPAGPAKETGRRVLPFEGDRRAGMRVSREEGDGRATRLSGFRAPRGSFVPRGVLCRCISSISPNDVPRTAGQPGFLG